MPGTASEHVELIGSTADGTQDSLLPFDPADRTKVVTPARDRIIRKALKREVSRLKRELFFRKLSLQLRYALLVTRRATSRLQGVFLG